MHARLGRESIAAQIGELGSVECGGPGGRATRGRGEGGWEDMPEERPDRWHTGTDDAHGDLDRAPDAHVRVVLCQWVSTVSYSNLHMG